MINSTDEETVKPDTPPELYSCPDKQSRSLREYDEELHNLRKENFNLKLRIFFLEGKPQGTNICPSTGPKTNHEQFSNQNLKVENKELRKELQEKQNLLHEAAHAIEVLENSLKRQQELNNITITELADEIKYIEGHSIQMSELPSETTPGYKVTDKSPNEIKKCEIVTNLQLRIDTLETIIKAKEMEIEQIQLENKFYDETNKDYGKTIAHLEAQIKNFDQSDHHVEMTDVPDKAPNSCKYENKSSIIQDLKEKLDKKTRAHEKGCKTIQLLLLKTRDLDGEIERLKYKIKTMNPQLPQTDIAREKSWWKSYTQICDMLTNRLCELAGFLDLLLKHKVIFNTLAHEEQRNIRKAIEDSLNLSRNLTTLTEEHFLTTSNDALDDDHNISEFLRTFQNESQKKDRLIEVDKKGTHKIEEEKPVYYYNQSDGCNLSEDESKRRIALQMIQNEFTSVNVLRGAVFQKFSNNLKTLRDTIIIHDSTSREDIYLQKKKLEQTLSETRNALQTSRQNETQFQIRISERETMLQKLKRSLDEATLQISKAVLERTKFMKERDSFEKFGQEYKEKYDHLLSESSGLHTKLALLEHENAQLVLKKTNKLNLLQQTVSVDDDSLQKGGKDCHDQNCEMIEKENRELKHKLERTRKAFEKTWAQLRFSNQRKEQIEKDMRQEIYKTHTVLKSARSNIENMTAPSEINLN